MVYHAFDGVHKARAQPVTVYDLCVSTTLTHANTPPQLCKMETLHECDSFAVKRDIFGGVSPRLQYPLWRWACESPGYQAHFPGARNPVHAAGCAAAPGNPASCCRRAWTCCHTHQCPRETVAGVTQPQCRCPTLLPLMRHVPRLCRACAVCHTRSKARPWLQLAETRRTGLLTRRYCRFYPVPNTSNRGGTSP